MGDKKLKSRKLLNITHLRKNMYVYIYKYIRIYHLPILEILWTYNQRGYYLLRQTQHRNNVKHV